MVTVTSALTKARIERLFLAAPPGEHAVHRSGAENTVSGLEKRHVVTPIALPRATAKHVRPAFLPPIRANGCPFSSFVPVTTRTEPRANPRRAKRAVTPSHCRGEKSPQLAAVFVDDEEWP